MSRPNISYPQPIPPNVNGGAGPSTYQSQPAATYASGSISGSSANAARRSSAQSSSSVGFRQPSGPRPGPNALDSCITRLLVATKQLLQALEQWAQGYLTENDASRNCLFLYPRIVSDIYVRLGDIFDTCVTSFNRAGIATRELVNIPLDLRRCLEEALAEEACQESLNLFLPTIRQIIYNLLDGLKRKQAQYKRSLAERQDSASYGAGSGSGGGTGSAPGSAGLAPSAAQGMAHSQSLGRLEGASVHPNPAGRQGSFGSIGTSRPSPQTISQGLVPGLEDDRVSVSARSAVSVASVHSNHSNPNLGLNSSSTNLALAQPQIPSAQSSRRASPSPTPETRIPSSALAERERERAQRANQQPHRPAPPDAFRPPRRVPSDGTTIRPGVGPSPQPPPNAPLPALPSAPSHQGQPAISQKSSMRGVQLKDDGPVASPSPSTASFPANILNLQQQHPPAPPPKAAGRDNRYSYNFRDRDSLGNPKPVSRFSADSDITTMTNGSPVRSPPSKSPPTGFGVLAEQHEYEHEHEGEGSGGEGGAVEDDGVISPKGRMTFGQRVGEQGYPGQSVPFDASEDAPSLPKLDLPNVSLLDSSMSLSSRANDADMSTDASIAAQSAGIDSSTNVAGSTNTNANLDLPPETKNTLATLRGFDTLERRASKRFSSYTMNKILPSSPSRNNLSGASGGLGGVGASGHSRKPSGLGLGLHGTGANAGESPQRPARRVSRGQSTSAQGVPGVPPLPASVKSGRSPALEQGPGGLSSGTVEGLPGRGRDGVSPSKSDISTGSVKVLDTPPSARQALLEEEEEDDDDRPLAAARSKNAATTQEYAPSQIDLRGGRVLSTVPESASTGGRGSMQLDNSSSPSAFTLVKNEDGQGQQTRHQQRPASLTHCSVYLQFGRQTKKAKLEYPITPAGIKMLFMERFEYDPGMDDFPEVYVMGTGGNGMGRDGVAFELEDMEDVVEGCVLSLNIEPLDQVKQHFDHTFASLVAEIKEMKSSLDRSRRISVVPSQASALLSASNVPPIPGSGASPVMRSSPRLGASSPRVSPSIASAIGNPFDAAPAAGTTTSAALPPAAQGQALTTPRRIDLEAQQTEIVSLRRDLAIMRQLHSDFLAETKTAFNGLKTQNNAMKEVINTKTGGSRALLDNSKIKLENASSETITAVEEIQDLIDTAKDDAQRRFAIPSNATMKKIRRDLAKAEELAEGYRTAVHSSEQMWRATWAHELQRVMEEQKLYKYQTTLGEDLRNDVRDAKRVWASVEEFVAQRVAAGHVQVEGAAGGSGTGNGSGSGTPRHGQAALRTPAKGLISQGINFRPPSPTDGSGMPHLLREIRSKESADPNQRLKAIEAQARAREREKAEKMKEENEFADELGEFVIKKKLKKTGGTEEVERMRNRKQEVVFRRMISGDTGTGSGTGSRNVTPTPTPVTIKKEPVTSLAVGATTGGGGGGASASASAPALATVKTEPLDSPGPTSAPTPTLPNALAAREAPSTPTIGGPNGTPSVQAVDPDNQPIKAEIDTPVKPPRDQRDEESGMTPAELRLQAEHEEVFGSPQPKSVEKAVKSNAGGVGEANDEATSDPGKAIVEVGAEREGSKPGEEVGGEVEVKKEEE